MVKNLKLRLVLNGKAVRERHHTDHNQPWAHSNPHDHIIDWTQGHPDPSKNGAINYPDGNPPTFKKYEGVENKMGEVIILPPDTNFDFESINDFKDSLNRGGEIEFKWNNKGYSITRRGILCLRLQDKVEIN